MFPRTLTFLHRGSSTSVRNFHFPTTHVGRLPAPSAAPVLISYCQDHSQDLQVSWLPTQRTLVGPTAQPPLPDGSPPEEVLERAVADTVQRQVELGITVVGDGEMSKPSYVSYVSQVNTLR